jgi:hypothetical protein
MTIKLFSKEFYPLYKTFLGSFTVYLRGFPCKEVEEEQ